MSISAGPNSINNGLIFAVDASNARSFRGEPTINLKTSTQDSYFSYGTGQYIFHGLETSGEYKDWYKITATNTSSNRLIMGLNGINALANTTYTASIEWISPNNSLNFEVNGNQGMGSGLFTGQSNRYYRTFTKNATPGSQHWYLTTPTQLVGEIISGLIYYRNVQFEQRNYFTKFTLGHRGLSVESGGGWADLSKNNNHCIFDAGSGIQFTGINLGSLHFSGDYAYVSPILGSNYPASYEVIMYPITFNNTVLLGMNNHTNTYDGISFLNNKLIVYFGASNYRYSNTEITPNQWYHVLVTVPSSDAKDCTIYINGNINQENSIHTGVPINLDRIAIGASSRNLGSNPFHGNISVVKIYNRVLSDSEVKQNFESLRGRFGL